MSSEYPIESPATTDSLPSFPPSQDTVTTEEGVNATTEPQDHEAADTATTTSGETPLAALPAENVPNVQDGGDTSASSLDGNGAADPEQSTGQTDDQSDLVASDDADAAEKSGD